MKKLMAAVMATVVAGVVLVGGALAGSQGRATADWQGMMPEVTVTAEMPRLVMPTVEVVAVRAVAMTGSDLHVD